MKNYSFHQIDLTDGFWFDKQSMNRRVTIPWVYDRFEETGRFAALDCDGSVTPHIYWDSDVAKWIESVAYTLKKHREPRLESLADALIAKIKEHQGADGYFNLYFTIVEPDSRLTDRSQHELYNAGHLIEAAIAYADATGKTVLLETVEKYVDYIYRRFPYKKSAGFTTPGHEEIELALIKLYRYTGRKKYLDMAKYFLDVRGTVKEWGSDELYSQTHLPVRKQAEAVGHAVRAMYLYVGMAYLAAETGEQELIDACKALWNDVTLRKMYVTGGIGSTYLGEAFTHAFDLPNDTAYSETCAAIGLVFFAHAMLALENNAAYADVIERALYNGVLSGISLDGRAFFYENPLEINLSERFSVRHGKRRFPITRRQECFSCSCCPPNLSRLLATLGNYLYGQDGDRLYINQFMTSSLHADGVTCSVTTDYPKDGTVRICADGVGQVALRIPSWCASFTLNRPYTMQNGYAVMENDGSEILAVFDMTPRAIWADSRVIRDAGRFCITRGPVVYCAESADNPNGLHSYTVPRDFSYTETFDDRFGLVTLSVDCQRRLPYEGTLYSSVPPREETAVLRLIPYHCFANRGESDMLVWLHAK